MILTTFLDFSVHLETPRQASWYHLAQEKKLFYSRRKANHLIECVKWSPLKNSYLL
jgi:hypothetical protein